MTKRIDLLLSLYQTSPSSIYVGGLSRWPNEKEAKMLTVEETVQIPSQGVQREAMLWRE